MSETGHKPGRYIWTCRERSIRSDTCFQLFVSPKQVLSKIEAIK